MGKIPSGTENNTYQVKIGYYRIKSDKINTISFQPRNCLLQKSDNNRLLSDKIGYYFEIIALYLLDGKYSS